MNPRALVLLVLGAVTLRVSLGGDLTTYVRPGVRWTVAAGAVVMVAVAVTTLVLRRPGGGDGPRRIGWLVLAPVIVFAIVRPPPLGLVAADRRPAPPPRHDGGFAPLPAHGVVPLTVGDLVVRTVWGHGAALTGRVLRIVGFVLRPARGGLVLARLVVTCCAADARPYDVRVQATRAPPARGTWVAVTGTYGGADPHDPLVPVLRNATVRAVPSPADPYEG